MCRGIVESPGADCVPKVGPPLPSVMANWQGKRQLSGIPDMGQMECKYVRHFVLNSHCDEYSRSHQCHCECAYDHLKCMMPCIAGPQPLNPKKRYRNGRNKDKHNGVTVYTIYKYVHIYIYIYVYICVCIYMVLWWRSC